MPKKTFALAALVLALALFASCQMPDYQLGFDVTGAFPSGSYANVGYEIVNIGIKKLDNVSIRIEVQTDAGLASAWTTQTPLDVGETKTGTLAIYVGPSLSAISSYYVTGSAWDTESDSGWF